MNRSFFCSTALCFSLLASPALAEMSSGDGAKKISDAFATYIGTKAIESGALKIVPAGDVYRATVDLSSVAGAFASDKGSLKFSAWTFVLAPQNDGTYKVTSDEGPELSLTGVTPKGKMDETVKMSGVKFEAIFDPKIMAFPTSKMTVDGIETKVVMPEGEVLSHHEKMAYTSTSAGNSDGSVSSKFHQTIESIAYHMHMVPVPDKPPVDMNYSIGPLVGDGAVQAMRQRELMNLVAFMVAHSDKAQLVAEQDEFKTKLLALLPLWQNFNANVSVKDASYTIPSLGPITMKGLGEKIAVTGLVKSSKLDFGIKLDSLTVPPKIAPDWAAGLVPTDIDINFSLSGADLDQAARVAIADLDMSREKPFSDNLNMKLMPIFMTGQQKLVIEPSVLKSSALEIDFSGEGSFANMAPGLKMTVTAKGLEQVLARLATVTDPGAKQALSGLTMAKSLGKPNADGSTGWLIEISKDGYFVNGQKMR